MSILDSSMLPLYHTPTSLPDTGEKRFLFSSGSEGSICNLMSEEEDKPAKKRRELIFKRIENSNIFSTFLKIGLWSSRITVFLRKNENESCGKQALMLTYCEEHNQGLRTGSIQHVANSSFS